MLRVFILTFFIILQLNAQKFKDVDEIFKSYKIKGTILIENKDTKDKYIYNESRAKIQYSPASTFKIPNTLIALNEEIVTKDAIVKWDGKKRKYAQWNKDQTLQSAFKNSCVWCYQEFAKKIPKVIYENYLVAFNYGNTRIRRDIENFWLDGALRINSFDQLEFIKRFYNYDLAIKKEHIDEVKKFMIQKKKNGYILSYKTGWNGKIGWIVGYIQKGDNVDFFVFNANISEKQLPVRENILLEVLKLEGFIKDDF